MDKLTLNTSQAVSAETLKNYDTKEIIKNYELNKQQVDNLKQNFLILASDVNQINNLKDCNQKSIASALIVPSSLGLSLNYKQFYIVPYKSDAQVIIDARGYVKLLRDAGIATQIKVASVYSKHKTYAEAFNENTINANVNFNNTNKSEEPVGYVAWFKDKYDNEYLAKMSQKEMQDHFEKFSKTYKATKTFSVATFEQMAHKTIIKKVIRANATLNPEVQKALDEDAKVYNKTGIGTYADNETGEIIAKEQLKVELAKLDFFDFEKLKRKAKELLPNQNAIREWAKLLLQKFNDVNAIPKTTENLKLIFTDLVNTAKKVGK